MALLLDVPACRALIQREGLTVLFKKAIAAIEQAFARWDMFDKQPRVATHWPHGVIELMPIADDTNYAFKYVNGHPQNPDQGKLTVGAMGVFADVMTGYPLLISEMTLLTAIRTAATSALVSRYCAPSGATALGVIGTGAQSEFQVIAHQVALGVDTVFYYDIDPVAMKKFAANLSAFGLSLVPCDSIESVVSQSLIVTTLTATKAAVDVLTDAMIKRGVHINAVGGDCPGKTELEAALLERARVIVSYREQTQVEGEIQQMPAHAPMIELWQLVSGQCVGRASDDEVTLFDSVGFALEDFAMLQLVYTLLQSHGLGKAVEMIPGLSDPKDLFSLVL